MPTPQEILSGLSLASNKFIAVSILWHLIVLAFVLLLLSGKKFNKKHVSAGLSLMLLSVGIIAVLVSNPFNAIMFALAALLFGILTLSFKPEPIKLTWDFSSVTGMIILAFGFVYPHFLADAHFLKYLYASPLGLIPCPTLSAFIGLTLLFHGFGSKKWMITASIFGLFYGIFGVFRLKVSIDTVLIAGALFLLIYAIIARKKEMPKEPGLS